MGVLSRANYPPPSALHVDDALLIYSGSLNQLAYCDWVPMTQTPEPPDPTVDGQGCNWLSNGVGDGNAGDWMYKTREGGVIKIYRIIDFSIG